MASDPAFLFYPGDYLRDTQNLSPATQVAYDRIMCEHMRNICVRHNQLKFFTKRLSDDEKEELSLLLTETDKGFTIGWVAESINKRRAYSDSRRKNRRGKKEKDMKDISASCDSDMEIEIEDVNRDNKKGGEIEISEMEPLSKPQEKLRNEICKHFGFNEQSNFAQFKLATSFSGIATKETIDQFGAYRKLRYGKFLPQFLKFIGTVPADFKDSILFSENWKHRLRQGSNGEPQREKLNSNKMPPLKTLDDPL